MMYLFLLHCNAEFINEGKQKNLPIYLEIGVIYLSLRSVKFTDQIILQYPLSFSRFDTITALKMLSSYKAKQTFSC